MKKLFWLFLSILVTGCAVSAFVGGRSWAATASCQSRQEGKLDCMEFSGNLPAALKQVCTMPGGAQWVNSPCPNENVLGFCEVPRKDNIRQRVYCYRMAQIPDAQRIEFCRMGCNGTFTVTQGKLPAPKTGAVAPTPATRPSSGSTAAPTQPPRTTTAPAAAAQYAMEQDTNRFGEDYKDLGLTTPNPSLCAQACMNEPKCKAWTYVKPGVQS